MDVTFANTDPVEYPLESGRTYYIAAADGDLTVKRKKLDGAWVAVDGSPVSDGEERLILTHSHGGKIQVTASAAGTEMVLKG